MAEARESSAMSPEDQEAQHVAHLRGDLEDYIFGILDGLVTNLAVVAGVVAAGSAVAYPAGVRIAGTSALLAGGLSMFVGAYVSSQARYQLALRERRREEEEVERIPQQEKEEVQQIYRNWGFPEAEARQVTERIASDKKVWIDFMMREELGFTPDELERPPRRHGMIIGAAYMAGSFVPLLPFLLLPWLLPHVSALVTLLVAILVGGLCLATVGALKERFGSERPWIGGLQMVGIGLGAAAVVYVITNLLFHP